VEIQQLLKHENAPLRMTLDGAPHMLCGTALHLTAKGNKGHGAKGHGPKMSRSEEQNKNLKLCLVLQLFFLIQAHRSFLDSSSAVSS
jgi:hypothetical protein